MLTIIVTKWCNRQPLIIHSSLFICIAPSIDLFHCVCIDYEADIAGYTIISTAGKNRGLPFCTSLYIIYISFINYCLYRRLLFMFHNNPLNKLIHRLRYQPSSMNACVHVLEIWRPTPGSSPLSRYAGTISLCVGTKTGWKTKILPNFHSASAQSDHKHGHACNKSIITLVIHALEI